MSPHEKLVLAVTVGVLLAVGVGWAFHWWVLDVRCWLDPVRGLLAKRRRDRMFDEDWQREPADLPGQGVPAPLAGEHHPTADEWEQLDPDEAADVWVAELLDDLPGPSEASAHPTHRVQRRKIVGAGELDAWDAWWAGLDGLTKECWEVTRLVEREREAWAVLVAETRELCGLAA